MKLQLLSDCKIRYLFLSDKIFCVYYFAMLKDAKSTTANGGVKCCISNIYNKTSHPNPNKYLAKFNYFP